MKRMTWLFRSAVSLLLMMGAACGPKPEREEDSTTYQTALKLLTQGQQKQAEELLALAVEKDATNQRLVFFKGVCARSRWMKREAWPIFHYLTNLSPNTPEGQCSGLMLAIDTQEEYEANFSALEELLKQNPDDPLILWMTAVACRELGKRGAPREYSEKGALYYATLLDTMDPGPVLLHQSYANILSEELGRNEEALKHREIALRLAPTTWSHQGMANTLSRLQRYEEADVHYQKCTDMAPDNSHYLANWAWSMGQRKDYEQAFLKYKKVAEMDPDRKNIWKTLGWYATKLNLPEAPSYYTKHEATSE